jgi:hypothetical protein
VTLEEELLELEERFWTEPERLEFYSAHLAGDAVMVFPSPYGIFDEARILDSLEGPVWSAVRLEQATVVRLRDAAAALVYRAEADGPGGRAYSCYAASVYVRQDDQTWRLALHQQTPIA